MTVEAAKCEQIDALFISAGWHLCDVAYASLDIFGLRNESLTDSDNLPPPEVVAQEIVGDLEAALEQCRLIAADLGEKAEVV